MKYLEVKNSYIDLCKNYNINSYFLFELNIVVNLRGAIVRKISYALLFALLSNILTIILKL